MNQNNNEYNEYNQTNNELENLIDNSCSNFEIIKPIKQTTKQTENDIENNLCIICLENSGLNKLCLNCNYIYCVKCAILINYKCCICHRNFPPQNATFNDNIDYEDFEARRPIFVIDTLYICFVNTRFLIFFSYILIFYLSFICIKKFFFH